MQITSRIWILVVMSITPWVALFLILVDKLFIYKKWKLTTNLHLKFNMSRRILFQNTCKEYPWIYNERERVNIVGGGKIHFSLSYRFQCWFRSHPLQPRLLIQNYSLCIAKFTTLETANKNIYKLHSSWSAHLKHFFPNLYVFTVFVFSLNKKKKKKKEKRGKELVREMKV